jgi:hypothetical protein
MKQKPPPGATLIARLKEGRLRREQELAERQQGKGAQGKAKAGSGKGEAPVIEAEAVTPAAKVKKSQAPAESFAPEVPVQDIETRQVPARTRGKEGMDIIHREISIEDLRPASDDYQLLTEEIRLAGRFAAVGLIAQGMRLARLKDDDIYKHHYPTFEEYCRQEHTMSATYAYRLIRVAEMAERLGEEGHKMGGKLTAHLHNADAMPDPFEVMLGLGHRHLMALLPLTPDTAEDLLVHGVPVTDESGKVNERIPIVKATEQQIRQALKLLSPASDKKAKPHKKAASAPSAKSVRTLEDMVDVVSAWADWLEAGPDEKAITDKLGSTRDSKRLMAKLEKVNQRFIDALKQALKDSHQGE